MQTVGAVLVGLAVAVGAAWAFGWFPPNEQTQLMYAAAGASCQIAIESRLGEEVRVTDFTRPRPTLGVRSVIHMRLTVNHRENGSFVSSEWACQYAAAAAMVTGLTRR